MQRERKNNTLSEVNSSKQLTSCTLALRTCGVRATLMHARARTATLISICPIFSADSGPEGIYFHVLSSC